MAKECVILRVIEVKLGKGFKGKDGAGKDGVPLTKALAMAHAQLSSHGPKTESSRTPSESKHEKRRPTERGCLLGHMRWIASSSTYLRRSPDCFLKPEKRRKFPRFSKRRKFNFHRLINNVGVTEVNLISTIGSNSICFTFELTKRRNNPRNKERKIWALAVYCSIRLCYMFSMSNCRGESDLGLCTAPWQLRDLQKKLLGPQYPLHCSFRVK